jgi:PilZ domain
MEEFGPPLSPYSTTARLFGLVDELPKDKQLILLEQLLGDRITIHICQLALELPIDQQQRLLEQLTEHPFDEAPVTTLNLDEDDTAMRQIHRKACRLKAVSVVDARTFESVITDISTVGMFIKTDAVYPPGKPIRVSCRLPGVERPLILRGEILRSEESGIGVRLKGLTVDQQKAIQSFIEQRA